MAKIRPPQPLYVGPCSPSLVPDGTFQTVSLGTSVNKLWGGASLTGKLRRISLLSNSVNRASVDLPKEVFCSRVLRDRSVFRLPARLPFATLQSLKPPSHPSQERGVGGIVDALELVGVSSQVVELLLARLVLDVQVVGGPHGPVGGYGGGCRTGDSAMLDEERVAPGDVCTVA